MNQSSSPPNRPGRRVWLGAFAGLTVGLSGCYRPYYYSPPQPMYPASSAPIQTLQPGPYYTPGQPVPAGQPYNGTFSPGVQPGGFPPSNLGQPTLAPPAGGGNSTFEPGSSGDFGSPAGDDFGSGFDSGGSDPYYPGTNSGPDLNSSVPDPSDYEDPATFQDPVRPDSLDDFESFRPTSPAGPSAFADPGLQAVPVENRISPSDDGPDIRQTAFASEAPYVPATQGETKLDPYGYEQGTYAWLRGVVSQDKADGSWCITYDLEPTTYDTYGGNLTLSADDRLSSLTDGDVVLVEGAVDTSGVDRLGKPLYRVGELVQLDVQVRD